MAKVKWSELISEGGLVDKLRLYVQDQPTYSNEAELFGALSIAFEKIKPYITGDPNYKNLENAILDLIMEAFIAYSSVKHL